MTMWRKKSVNTRKTESAPHCSISSNYKRERKEERKKERAKGTIHMGKTNKKLKNNYNLTQLDAICLLK